MEEELNAWRSENPEIVKESLTKKETKWVDKSELALFIATNPDAREHLDEIKEFAEEFGIKLDSEEALAKAWKRVKPSIPVESKTERDFDIKSKWSTKKVDLSKLSFEEIYSGDYTPDQKREWRNMQAK
jgi:MarR-like DNA-binding transcriptional regulator SgrR of sgrS sRNA